MGNQVLGAGAVALASLLWATDVFFRTQALEAMDPAGLAFLVNFLAWLAIAPWHFLRSKNELFALGAREWLALAFIGIGGAAFGTLFFTASFATLNPSVPVLLQKLQPLIAVLGSMVLLGERPGASFFFWAFIAFCSSVVLAFPGLDFSFVNLSVLLHSRGAGFALAAVVLWGLSTVASKIALGKTTPGVTAFWEYGFASLTLLVVLTVRAAGVPWHALVDGALIKPILGLSWIAGALGLLIYYRGLRRISASVAAFVELLYPLGTVLLATFVLHRPLAAAQSIAAAVLVAAMLALPKGS